MKIKKIVVGVLFFCILGMVIFPQMRVRAAETKNIVLVHGGWHGEWSWYHLVDELEERGYIVSLVELPAHGKDKTLAWNASADSYVNKITSTLRNINEKSILVVHGSSSGFASRAAELNPDKVDKLLFISGVLVRNNECVASALLQDTYSEAMSNAKLHLLKGSMSISPEIVYNLARRSDKMIGERLIEDEPARALFSGIKLGNNFNQTPKYYIQTIQDKSLSFQYQQKLVEKVPCNKVYQLNSGHVPFITEPKMVANIIDEISVKHERGLSPKIGKETQETPKTYDEPEIEKRIHESLDSREEVSLKEYVQFYDLLAEEMHLEEVEDVPIYGTGTENKDIPIYTTSAQEVEDIPTTNTIEERIDIPIYGTGTEMIDIPIHTASTPEVKEIPTTSALEERVDIPIYGTGAQMNDIPIYSTATGENDIPIYGIRP
ncbi:hypothetical protein FACS189418_1940 [Clostridia bacterium]|nr:hypothetical protein FACS189418_1940 [Clostridia bacterium]